MAIAGSCGCSACDGLLARPGRVEASINGSTQALVIDSAEKKEVRVLFIAARGLRVSGVGLQPLLTALYLKLNQIETFLNVI